MEGAFRTDKSLGQQCIPEKKSIKLLITLEVQNVFFTIRQILPRSTTRMLRHCCGRLRLLVDDAANVDTNNEKSIMMAKHMPLVRHGPRMNHEIRLHKDAKERLSAVADPALVARMAAGRAAIATFMNMHKE